MFCFIFQNSSLHALTDKRGSNCFLINYLILIKLEQGKLFVVYTFHQYVPDSETRKQLLWIQPVAIWNNYSWFSSVSPNSTHVMWYTASGLRIERMQRIEWNLPAVFNFQVVAFEDAIDADEFFHFLHAHHQD